MLEALQSNDWALDLGDALDGLDDDDDDDNGDSSSLEFGDFEKATSGRKATDLDPASLDFGFDKADFEGLRRAIWSSGVEAEDGVGVGDLGGSSTVKPSSSSGQDTATAAAAAAAAATETEDAADGGGKEGDGGDGEDSLGKDDVEKVEAMMRKLLAVREMGAGMPEEQRRRLAARAVGEVMREL